MNGSNLLQQLVRSTGTMVMQCRFVAILLYVFLFSVFSTYATLSMIPQIIESQIAKGFGAAIFLKPGITPEQEALEKVRAIPGIQGIELIAPASATEVIARQSGRPITELAKGVSVDRFPYTIILRLNRQYLAKANETIELVASELEGVQEVRYPLQGLQKALTNLERLKVAQRQLGVLLIFVLTTGCLSIMALAANRRPVLRWQYTVVGLLSGAAAALLMLLVQNMASSATGLELPLDGHLYLGMIAAGLASGVTGDFAARSRKPKYARKKAGNAGTTEITESLP